MRKFDYNKLRVHEVRESSQTAPQIVFFLRLEAVRNAKKAKHLAFFYFF
ncbi:hypothetical protein ALO_02616 [Acetonema longum DSM 6540]|uniref:Uncharacterized protein n=1 Tax=Acetonema longum DSM 6540 TaxID=1009370 RepID=F7NEQ8_9FIRM|nr:hypothetical protein ALO_02616 [Acetonema longum DSM 6540]